MKKLRGTGDVIFDDAFIQSHVFKPQPNANACAFSNTFAVNAEPVKIMDLVYDLSYNIDENVKISKSKWSLSFNGKLPAMAAE